MSIIKEFFGGTDDSAQDYTRNQNKRNTEYIKEQAGQSRSDALSMWPQADQARNQGYQSAYDILMRVIGPQIRTLRKGNVNAQRQLLAGLPQMQNAILGNPIDYSGIKPVSLSADTQYRKKGSIPGIPAGNYPLAGV